MKEKYGGRLEDAHWKIQHTTTLLPDKEKGKRSQQRKRPTYNTPARVLYVGECRNM